MCVWIYFVKLEYSQLKINHLNDTPSTKAAGGRIYSGVFDKDVKVPVKVTRLSLLVPLLPTLPLADTPKKLRSFEKKGFPLELRYVEMCTFSTKKLRH